MRRRILAALALAALIACVIGFFCLRPEPAAPELRGREVRTFSHSKAATKQVAAAGRVLDAQGLPAPDVTVEARDQDDLIQSVTTDAEGRFAFEDLRTPAYLHTPDQPSLPGVQGVNAVRTDLEFQLVESCPLRVEVRGVAEATVTVEVLDGPPGAQTLTTEQGNADFDLPCGVVRVEGFAEGWPSALGGAWTLEEHEVVLQFEQGLRIFGQVTDTEGAPVRDAALWGHVWATTDVDGLYSALIEPARVVFFSVESEHHRSEKEVLYVPEGTVELEHNVTLEAAHVVQVRCAGLENDSCAELPLILCTQPNLPVGHWCWEMAGEVTCRCPEGEAAVRGGGVSVLVGPDDDVAWLDLRTDGSLSGRVLADGRPTACSIDATRFSVAADLGLRMAGCDDEGRFELKNLPSGSWRLMIQAPDGQRVLGPVEVDGPVDLGDVELDGGGRIEGFVLSEVDEHPVQGVAIAAVGLDALESGSSPPTGNARTDADGFFAIQGLPEGRYEVFLAAHPLTRERIDLVEFADVTLYRPVAGDLETEVDEDGNWIVTGVGDDAPEGFVEGDVILGVELFGVNPADVLPGWGREATPALLGMADWPGVTVITE